MSNYPQTLLSCPIAKDGDRSAVPVTSLEAGTGRLSQEEGWGRWNSLPIGEGGIPPKRDDFNSVLYLLSSFLVWYQQGGLMNYSATLDYEPGNAVLVGTVKYRCLKANGPSSTVKSPTDQANTAYWSNQDVGEVRYDKAQSLTTSDQARARKNIDVQSTSEVAKQLADAIKGFVAFDKAQSLSNEQKAQARTNIGVTSSGDMNDAIEEAVADVVKHTPQSLNANQQAQARKNIGAAPVASPTFTGTPTVPTAASGDSSQQVANTAWVKNAISSSASEDYVVETHRSGSTWYRKWKSGFIEQHGTIGGGSGTAKFVTPFKYPDSVSLQLTATGGGHPDDCYTIAKVVDGSSFSYNIRRFNGGNWYAAGY